VVLKKRFSNVQIIECMAAQVTKHILGGLGTVGLPSDDLLTSVNKTLGIILIFGTIQLRQSDTPRRFQPLTY
jgi:hypothetical protein